MWPTGRRRASVWTTTLAARPPISFSKAYSTPLMPVLSRPAQPEDVSRQLALGVVAAVLGQEAHPVELEIAHPLGGAGIHLALDPDEGALLLELGHERAALLGVQAEGPSQGGGRRLRVVHVLGYRVEALGVDGHRQGAASRSRIGPRRASSLIVRSLCRVPCCSKNS